MTHVRDGVSRQSDGGDFCWTALTADAALQEPSGICRRILTSKARRPCRGHRDPVCPGVYVGESPVCLSTEDGGQIPSSSLRFLPPPVNSSLVSPAPCCISTLIVSDTTLTCAGRGRPPRDSPAVSRRGDTPLHMLTSILPGTDAGWCSRYFQPHPAATRTKSWWQEINDDSLGLKFVADDTT